MAKPTPTQELALVRSEIAKAVEENKKAQAEQAQAVRELLEALAQKKQKKR